MHWKGDDSSVRTCYVRDKSSDGVVEREGATSCVTNSATSKITGAIPVV